MKKFEFFYDNLIPLDNLTNLSPKDDLLFFDIETTGLSRVKNHIYLIGIGFYTNNGLKIIQWFAENESDELVILKEFINFSSSFTNLVNYNGKTFDIPFTIERLNKYGLSMPNLNSIDIYCLVKPLKKILSLNDLTQKSIESFLNIKREDKYSGGELISVYKTYENLNVHKKDEEESATALNMLITHNKEDVLNMHFLTKILDYSELHNINVRIKEYKINKYNDYNGNTKLEMIILGLHNFSHLPKSFNTFKNDGNGSYIMNFSCNNELQIRIPILEKDLYYFFPNYKDYYYLPNDNICILKSMAGGVLKENRENAKKENCCIKHNSSYIKLPIKCQLENTRTFKESYKAKESYIRLEDFDTLSNDQKDRFIKDLYLSFFV